MTSTSTSTTRCDIPDLSQIPEEIRGLEQWLIWKYQEDDKGKMTKVPYSPCERGRRCGATAKYKNLWNTAEYAIKAAHNHGCDGIGFVFTDDDPYVGIDFDAAVDPETGDVSEWANGLLNQACSYTEMSVSNTGKHVICRGATSRAGAKANVPNAPSILGKGPQVEIYSTGRYFVFTGDTDGVLPIRDDQNFIEVVEDVIGGWKGGGLHVAAPAQKESDHQPDGVYDISDEPLDDGDNRLVDGLILRSKMFRELWSGLIHRCANDQSKADYTLVMILLENTGFDRKRTVKLFTASKLGRRDKWRGRLDYRERTVEAAYVACKRRVEQGVSADHGWKPAPDQCGKHNDCAPQKNGGNPPLPNWLVPDGVKRPAVEAISELANLIAPHETIFMFNGEPVRLLSRKRQPYCTKRKTDEVRDDYTTTPLTPTQFITAIERYCRPTRLRKGEEVGTILNAMQARIALDSAEFAAALPELRRVLNGPIPVVDATDGTLRFPSPGFDSSSGTFLKMDAIQARPLPLTRENTDWALAVLAHLLAYGDGDSFAYATPQDECHSFARFLTPFCRGIMGWAKTPVWTFEADDPGTGKDTLADLTHVQQTGSEIGYAPTTDPEEMRKILMSFLLRGGSYFHVGNVRGFFKFAAFEQATSASRVYSDRLLGSNKEVSLCNEAEYSFSANDATFTPDILRRSRRIFQCWEKGNVNKRHFRIPGIVRWVHRNRSQIATAVLTLISAYWEWRATQKGVAEKKGEFSSFPEWADIVGGLCVWAGFGDPTCDHLLDVARRDIGATESSEDLEFLRLLSEENEGEWIKHGMLMDWMEANVKDVFQSVSWEKEASWKRQIGRKLAKLIGKERGSFKLERRGGEHHQNRTEYRVARVANGGNEAHESPSYTGGWFKAPSVPFLDTNRDVALPN